MPISTQPTHVGPHAGQGPAGTPGYTRENTTREAMLRVLDALQDPRDADAAAVNLSPREWRNHLDAIIDFAVSMRQDFE